MTASLSAWNKQNAGIIFSPNTSLSDAFIGHFSDPWMDQISRCLEINMFIKKNQGKCLLHKIGQKAQCWASIKSSCRQHRFDCMLVSGLGKFTQWVYNWLNTLRPKQNACHFPENIFRCIFLNENVWISISLKFVPKCPINNIPALFQIMTWHWPGDKPLSEPMLVCFTDAYMRHSTSMS